MTDVFPLIPTRNLSDLTSVATARTNLSMGAMSGGLATSEVLTWGQTGAQLNAPTMLNSFSVTADGASTISVTRSSDNTSGPTLQFIKQRGTTASPSDAAAGDIGGNVLFRVRLGGASRNIANIYAVLESGASAGADSPGSLVFETTPDGSATQVERLRIDSTGQLRRGFGLLYGWKMRPLATVTTTDATLTTLETIPMTSAYASRVKVSVVARRTGGTLGTAEDCAAYERVVLCKMVTGTAVIVGAVLNGQAMDLESQALWDCTVTNSGGNLLVQVTGAISNNITWLCQTQVWEVNS